MENSEGKRFTANVVTAPLFWLSVSGLATSVTVAASAGRQSTTPPCGRFSRLRGARGWPVVAVHSTRTLTPPDQAANRSSHKAAHDAGQVCITIRCHPASATPSIAAKSVRARVSSCDFHVFSLLRGAQEATSGGLPGSGGPRKVRARSLRHLSSPTTGTPAADGVE